jgi:hypothetical protein
MYDMKILSVNITNLKSLLLALALISLLLNTGRPSFLGDP